MTRIVCALLLVVFLSNETVSNAQEFLLGEVRTVPAPQPAIAIYPFCPDGHVPFLKDGDEFQMYWAGSTSYRTCGRSVFDMGHAEVVLSPGPKGSYDNGGAWFYAAFRQGENTLIGFYHAEDHEFGADPESKFIAWKSVALCTSRNNGKTWEKHGRIITSNAEKPDQPMWGGCGDFCVVWDEKNRRWVCFYQEHYLYVAVSTDRDGKPGTWKKYHNGDFTEPGLGGRHTPVPGLDKHAGGNPSVHFNRFLKKWVMVWATWEESSPSPNSIWLSTSADLLKWSTPRVVLEASGRNRYWYPTVIGDSDVDAGEVGFLCYAYFPDKAKHEREFRVRKITFKNQK